MMHGFGDSAEPLIESARMIEDVVLQQMRSIVYKACEVADRRNSRLITPEDFIFLMRKDKVKVQRLLKYLGALKLPQENEKSISNQHSLRRFEGDESVDEKSSSNREHRGRFRAGELRLAIEEAKITVSRFYPAHRHHGRDARESDNVRCSQTEQTRQG